jgi:Ca2+-binding RTX toxin-like protein
MKRTLTTPRLSNRARAGIVLVIALLGSALFASSASAYRNRGLAFPFSKYSTESRVCRDGIEGVSVQVWTNFAASNGSLYNVPATEGDFPPPDAPEPAGLGVGTHRLTWGTRDADGVTFTSVFDAEVAATPISNEDPILAGPTTDLRAGEFGSPADPDGDGQPWYWGYAYATRYKLPYVGNQLLAPGTELYYTSNALSGPPTEVDRVVEDCLLFAPANPCDTPGAILGTAGNDNLVGTPGPDIICGLGGNDVINGLGGGDILYGGAGADLLLGGSGADVLYGEGGADALFGQSGDDQLFGGAGPDLLVGGRGTDTLDGGAGENLLIQ